MLHLLLTLLGQQTQPTPLGPKGAPGVGAKGGVGGPGQGGDSSPWALLTPPPPVTSGTALEVDPQDWASLPLAPAGCCFC